MYGQNFKKDKKKKKSKFSSSESELSIHNKVHLIDRLDILSRSYRTWQLFTNTARLKPVPLMFIYQDANLLLTGLHR